MLEKLGSEADAEVKAVHFDQYDCTATWWTTEMSENKAHIEYALSMYAIDLVLTG